MKESLSRGVQADQGNLSSFDVYSNKRKDYAASIAERKFIRICLKSEGAGVES